LRRRNLLSLDFWCHHSCKLVPTKLQKLHKYDKKGYLLLHSFKLRLSCIHGLILICSILFCAIKEGRKGYATYKKTMLVNAIRRHRRRSEKKNCAVIVIGGMKEWMCSRRSTMIVKKSGLISYRVDMNKRAVMSTFESRDRRYGLSWA
jgi:hypothetical protein